ncbi:hypothetical protein AWZ03_015059, partial [Drosophila navojoa]
HATGNMDRPGPYNPEPSKSSWQIVPTRIPHPPRAKSAPTAKQAKVEKASTKTPHTKEMKDDEASNSSLESGETRRKEPFRKSAPLNYVNSLSRENRFSALSDNDLDEVDMKTTTDPLPTTSATQTAPAKQIKPPPIFIPNVALAIGNTNFDYKAGKDSSVRINLPDKE